MDPITEKLSQLQELSNEELSELEESVLNEFSATESEELTTQSVSKLTQLADAVEAVRSEKSRRATEAAALEEAAAEAATRVKGAEDSEENVEEATADAEEGSESNIGDKPEVEEEETEVPVEVTDEEEEEEEEMPEFSSESEASEENTETAETESDSEAANKEAEEKDKDSDNEYSEASVEVAEEAEASSTEEEGSNDSEASAEEPAEAEAAVEEEDSSEASVETSDEAEASVEEETENNTEATVTAAPNGSEGSLNNMEPPADRKPQVKPAAELTITAGADIPGYTAGTKLNNTLEVAEAFQKRLHSLRHVHGGDGEQHIVASFAQEFPEDRFLSANDPLENSNRIQDVTSPEAITAAAGVCLPLETRYDLGCDVGVTDRPVRDALARFGADRGGIRFFTAPTLEDGFEGATGFWRGDGSDPNSGDFHTYESDRTTATTPADAKPCLEVDCVAEATAYVEAVTLCLTFNNLTTRTFPELIKRQNELAMVAHARAAENALLAQIEAGSTAISAQAQVVGATREILNLFDRAVAAYRYKHRMSSSGPLRAVIPAWVKNLLRSDLALQMPGDGLEVLDIAESKINAWFRSRGVNVAWHLDGDGPAAVDLDGAGSGTAVGFEFPDSIEFALFAEGSWLFLDGGTLDIGVIRDSSLVATNQYKEFVETFEGVANVGCDSFWVTAAYEPCGTAAALVETC